MRCCDCEFRKECRDEDAVLTCFVKCYIREKKLKQKAEQDHPTEKGGETLDNIQKYCNDCDIKGYCDKIPTNCPIAKEYKRIAEFEKAKSELKSELSKPFIKFLDWLENKLQRIEKWWHNG